MRLVPIREYCALGTIRYCAFDGGSERPLLNFNIIVLPSDMLVKAVELRENFPARRRFTMATENYQNALGLSDSLKSLVISH